MAELIFLARGCSMGRSGRRNVVVAGIGALLLGATGPAAASPADLPVVTGGADLLGLSFQFININSGKCLTVVGAAVGDNAKLIQKACTREPSYRWRFVPILPTAEFQIQNVHSGKCLSVAADGVADNDFAVQQPCDNSPTRRWQLRNQPGAPTTSLHSDAQVVNEHSAKCLTIAGGTTTENAVAVQYTCDNHRSRRWTVRLVASPLFDASPLSTTS